MKHLMMIVSSLFVGSLAMAQTFPSHSLRRAIHPVASPVAPVVTRHVSNETAQIPANELVFMGSSTIQFWETMQEDFPQFETVNLGVWGSDYGDLLNDVMRFIDEHPSPRYVIYSGDNDIANGSPPEEVLARLTKLSEIIHGALPQARLYVISIKPTPERRAHIPEIRIANRMIRDFASKSGLITFVDTFSLMLDDQGNPRPELFREDGLHMNADGYVIWRKTLMPFLLEN